jgi:hypothetical protein
MLAKTWPAAGIPFSGIDDSQWQWHLYNQAMASVAVKTNGVIMMKRHDGGNSCVWHGVAAVAKANYSKQQCDVALRK